MARWKKKENKRMSTIQYLNFKKGEVKELTVSDWDFTKSHAGYLFKCYVIKEGGQEVDKVWTVWDYESAQLLKKKLGVKFLSGSKDLKIKMYVNEEDDNAFEIL